MFLHKKQMRILAIAFFSLLFFTACHNYYKATQTTAVNNIEKAASIDSLNLENRYFVLRNGGQAYYMKNISISADQKTMTCTLDSLLSSHQLHLIKGRKGNMKYKKNNPDDLMVLNEVHFYIQPDAGIVMGQNLVQLDKIQKIEVIQKDRKRTTSSYVIGAIGYTVGALALVSIILVATKSSCPFVSAYDGNNFSLQGEIYGGAIYPQLARHDYMPLKMEPMADGSLQLKISNELHEHQFTDMAELWVITHDKKSQVSSDEQGNLYSISAPQAPVLARLNDKKDVLPSLLKAGDNALLYMDDTTAVNAENEVVMKFTKPVTAKNAKLLLSLKNSYFLDLLYGELAKGFGNYYGTYIKQQQQKPASEVLQWVKDQNIPLAVSVKTKEGWKKITGLSTIGPLANRNIILPVELTDASDPFIEIKLSSGFMFWEIDYAAMDYTEENNFTVQKINPSIATDEAGKNILPLLQKEDKVYLAQPDIGNTATIVYNAATLNDNSRARTYILHSKGYYEHVRNFTNKPNVAFLNQFKKPDALPLYGLNLYKKMNKETLATMAKTN